MKWYWLLKLSKTSLELQPSTTLMHILQHQDLHIIPSSVLRVGAVPNECLPTFSTEVSKGNSGSKASKGQHIYFK